ncbi:MAG: poly-beta-1,6-N-acetyl-D-glucosamine N-deacetylase PgaB [Pseudomonadota bacterium]
MKILLLIVMLLMSGMASADTQPFQVLCYHDVRDNVDGDLDADSTAISSKNLARHFAWLQAHGYHPVSINDVINAKAGKKVLPAKPVLLTFDDGYQSFYTRVYPLLKLYNYPATFALVGSWLEVENGKLVSYGDEQMPREHFLSKAQIKEIADSGLVEFASHSYDLHHGVLANPQGNQTPAAVTLQYDAASQSYESEAEYTKRIQSDLQANNQLIKKLTGKSPRVMVWPYGANNNQAIEVAKQLGMPITLTLSEAGLPNTGDLSQIGRYLVDGNQSEVFLADLSKALPPTNNQRVMHIDLDYVFDKDAAQMARNLDILLDRVQSLAPSTVYLQAYSDQNGDGVAESVYFPSRHVAMRADLFSRVAWQLRTRANVQVYAWMPVLAFELNDKQKQLALQVVSTNPAADKNAYKRLSPFSDEARQIIKDIYTDLGAHAQFAGILFHDDATLSENEDDSQFARSAYQARFKQDNLAAIKTKPADANSLMVMKSRRLTQFTLELAQILKRYQPELKTARNLYAPAMLNPQSERWLAQNYQDFLAAYDYTAVMAMPLMEGAENPKTFLTALVNTAKTTKNGLQKTVFELQARDWKTKQALPANDLIAHMQTLTKAGAWHLGYYPDDFLNNQPEIEAIRPYISSRIYPYLPNLPKAK